MSRWRTTRELALVRTGEGEPAKTVSVELTVSGADVESMDVRFDAARERPADLEQAAADLLRTVADRLPEPIRPQLAVELGCVRCHLDREDDGQSTGSALQDSSYRMAVCRGTVLGLAPGRDSTPFRSPWTGVLRAEEIDPALPVVLGPSAVLALVSYGLEVTGERIATRSSRPAGVDVIDTASSPYPPQHHPFTGRGEQAPDRALIEDGLWWDREEHAGDHVDPLFFLLTRPERALRPLAAATHYSRRNLAVTCRSRVPVRDRAVVVDSWRVRVGPRAGRAPFDAYLSQTNARGGRLAVPDPVHLELDPWQVLARVRGACGSVEPAVDEDPIEGDSFSAAPAVELDLDLAALSPQ